MSDGLNQGKYLAACETEDELRSMRRRLHALETVITSKDAGLSLSAIAETLWMSVPTLSRLATAWHLAEESGNPRLLLPGKSTGRRAKVELSEASVNYLRKLYVKSNRCTGRGSMTSAARYAARTHDAENPLTETERAGILDCGGSKHNLTTAVRRAMRGTDALVADYRDKRTRQLGGTFAPGTVRMTLDEQTGLQRRVHAGERWCGDDGSVNFIVCVPWPWGGDPCSDRYGVRVGRYQLLPLLDVREDRCVAWQYTMRSKDSYRADDIVALYDGAFRMCGYAPAEMVSEGGSWQSLRVLEFLRAAGVRVIDAKGRPHQKVIEPWFGKLWSQLSLRTSGQIGRYRGEMRRENELLSKCQSGAMDPRRCFPSLEEAMNAIEWAIPYLNGDQSESKEYGTCIPDQEYALSLAEHPRAAYTLDLGHLALRVRKDVKVRRFGQVAVTADSPLGFPRRYHFSAPELMTFNRARVWVHFDPMATPVVATITLAEDFEDHKAGVVLARRLHCLNSAPEVIRDDAGVWSVSFSNGVYQAQTAKRLSRLAVRRELRALSLDGSRISATSEISAPEGVTKQLGIAATAEAEAEKETTENLPHIMSRMELAAS